MLTIARYKLGVQKMVAILIVEILTHRVTINVKINKLDIWQETQ